MKFYNLMAISGLYLLTCGASNYNNPELNKIINTPKKQNYTVVVSVGKINPTEGVGLKTTHNKDTITIETNYLGIANFQAYPGDTLNIYPTEKSGKFSKLEKVLSDTSFNIIQVEPIVESIIAKDSFNSRGYNDFKK
jgi:hypothetical protein